MAIYYLIKLWGNIFICNLIIQSERSKWIRNLCFSSVFDHSIWKILFNTKKENFGIISSFSVLISSLKDLSKYKIRNELKFNSTCLFYKISGKIQYKKIIMCTGENWGCLDEVCCPLRTKAIFFAFWTLVHQLIGIIFIILYGTILYSFANI